VHIIKALQRVNNSKLLNDKCIIRLQHSSRTLYEQLIGIHLKKFFVIRELKGSLPP
jgi:hypothetical protein